MLRRSFNRWLVGLSVGILALGSIPVFAADEAADAMIQRLSTDVLNTIKADKTFSRAIWRASSCWSITRSCPT